MTREKKIQTKSSDGGYLIGTQFRSHKSPRKSRQWITERATVARQKHTKQKSKNCERNGINSVFAFRQALKLSPPEDRPRPSGIWWVNEG